MKSGPYPFKDISWSDPVNGCAVLTEVHSFSERCTQICQTAFSLLIHSIGLATMSRTSHVINQRVTALCNWVTAFQFCPLMVHQVYHHQHCVLHKLGHGSCTTIWLSCDLLPPGCVYDIVIF